MKKNLLCLFLVFVSICFAACSAEKAREQAPAAGDASAVTTLPGTNPPLAELPPVYHATIEYGEPDLITDNAGPLWAYIRFPVAGEPTDEVIAQWALEVYQNAYNTVAELRKEDPEAEGEVNAQFDSYFVDGRYAGILESGMFMSSHLAHPTSILRTFNLDTKNGTFLQNSDILDNSQNDLIFDLLREKIIAEYPDSVDFIGVMDEKWLEHITIGPEGIIVVLERGAFLPGYLGALRITLPYDELGTALVLGTEPDPEPEQTGPPAVSPANPLIPKDPLQSGKIDPAKPLIALTFDDGPSKHTAQILDILERYGARATFCVVGNLVDAGKDPIKRATDLGCEVIGHSWDHRDLSKLTADEIKKELNSTSAVIEAVTGVSPRLYRAPYGATSATLKNVSAELGYALINWSVDPEDWRTRNTDSVYTAVSGTAKNKAIVLSHDIYGSTADAYERIIPKLIAQGYQLVTVSELMYYSGITLEAGKVYNNG